MVVDVVQNDKGLIRGLLPMVGWGGGGVQVEMRMKIRQDCTVILKEWAYVSLWRMYRDFLGKE